MKGEEGLEGLGRKSYSVLSVKAMDVWTEECWKRGSGGRQGKGTRLQDDIQGENWNFSRLLAPCFKVYLSN